MKRKTTMIFAFAMCISLFLSGQPSVKDGSLQELPLLVDFEEFTGTNLSEIYPGWQEGKGYQNPQYAGSAWYSADVIHDSKTAAVSFTPTGLKDEWIISPQFMVTETTKISFKAALSRFWDEPAPANFSQHDSVSVLISTNLEQFEFNHLIYSFKIGSQPGWELEPYQFDLSEFAGQLVHLAFYATNGQEPMSLAAFHLDDIEIKNAVDFDVMPVSLIAPVSNECLEGDVPVVVDIRNDGLEAVSSVPVRVKVRGAVNENLFSIYQGTLQPGEEAEFQVGVLENLSYGDYHFTIQTELDTDTYNLNDQITGMTISHPAPEELPLPFMNFIGFYQHNLGDIYPGWYEARGKNEPLVAMNTDWQGGTYNGVRVANVYYAGLGTNDWMISPKFVATDNLVVEMKAAIEYVQGGTQMGSDDKLALMVSADCGQTWDEVAAITQDFGINPTLQQFLFPIEGYHDQEIILAFYATTGDINDPQQYLIHITDISIKNLYDLDAGINRILAPGASCAFGNEEELIVEIKNFGQQTISGFQVAYSLNGQEPVVETVSQSIAYNDVLEYTFTSTLDLTQQDENTISVYTILEGDENPDNDGLFDVPFILSSFDLTSEGQYTMGFEEDEDFSDWLVEDGNSDGVTWELLHDPAFANNGSYSFAYFSNQTSTPSNDWLFSPCFYLHEGETYYVSFFYRNRATNFPESLKLEMGQGQSEAAMTTTLIDLGAISNSNYMKAETTFTVGESGEYYFGWHAYGPADQFGMHVDDITIYQIFENDLALLNFKADREKDAACMLLPVEELQIQVWNAGTQDVDVVSVELEINHGEPMLFEIDIDLEAGEIAWLTLSGDFILDPYELYHLQFTIVNEDDHNAANDLLIVEDFQHAQYHNGFEEDDEDFDLWTVQSLEGSNQWHVYEGPDQANTGSHALAIRTDSGGGNTGNDDWAITDCFYLEAGTCYEISFYYRSWFSTENLAVYIGQDNDHSAMDQLLIDIPSFNSNSYLFVSQQFTVEEDGVYYFGWHTDGPVSGRYYIFVDDISIVEDIGSQPVADPVTEILDLEVYFQANAENYSFLEWDFGDGHTSNQPDVFHVYEAAGTYNITLSMGSGCVEMEQSFTLVLECIMEPDFSFEVEGSVVTFTATGGAVAYAWDMGDGTLKWGESLEYDYELSEPQSFDVELTAYYPCGAETISKQVDVDVTVFVEEHTASLGLKVFPNPANDRITLEAEVPVQRILINDMQGRSVLDRTGINRHSVVLSLDALPAGMYLIHAYTENGVAVKKLLIQK